MLPFLLSTPCYHVTDDPIRVQWRDGDRDWLGELLDRERLLDS